MLRPLMTDRQRQVYQFVKSYIERFASPPTYRDVAERFGWKPNAAYEHVSALVAKGYLQRVKLSRQGGGYALALQYNKPVITINVSRHNTFLSVDAPESVEVKVVKQ